MSILEKARFGIKIGSEADLEIEALVSTVNIYAKADTLEELVQRSMMFQKLCCPDYTEGEVQRLKVLLTDEIPTMKGYSELAGKPTVKMVAWLGVVWKQDP